MAALLGYISSAYSQLHMVYRAVNIRSSLITVGPRKSGCSEPYDYLTATQRDAVRVRNMTHLSQQTIEIAAAYTPIMISWRYRFGLLTNRLYILQKH